MHTVRDYVKMLDTRISQNCIARTSVELGYYRSPSVSFYRVRRNSKAEGKFVEKIDPTPGYCTIYATVKASTCYSVPLGRGVAEMSD